MVTNRRPIPEPKVRGEAPLRNGQPSIAFDFTTDSIHPRLLCLCHPLGSTSSSSFSSSSTTSSYSFLRTRPGFRSLLRISLLRVLLSLSLVLTLSSRAFANNCHIVIALSRSVLRAFTNLAVIIRSRHRVARGLWFLRPLLLRSKFRVCKPGILS